VSSRTYAGRPSPGRDRPLLRPDGAARAPRPRASDGILSQATFDLNSGRATFIDHCEETVDPESGDDGVAQRLRGHSVDDEGVEVRIMESFEDSQEAARGPYLLVQQLVGQLQRLQLGRVVQLRDGVAEHHQGLALTQR